MEQIKKKPRKPKTKTAAITIDQEKLKKLMHFKPTTEMAAGFFDVSKKTMERYINENFDMTFKEFRDHYSAGMKIKLIQEAIRRGLERSDDLLKYSINNLCGWSYNPPPELESDNVEDMIF